MKKWIAKAVKWIWDQIKDEITAPINEVLRKIDANSREIAELKAEMKKAHQYDPAAKECDLASLDDQICQQIDKCRQRRYTTAEDRRRVGRMHRAYQARGGNDGETEEYAIFCRLPTEEEWRQAHSLE